MTKYGVPVTLHRLAAIGAQVGEVAALGLDGLNFDLEGQYNVTRRDAVTSLVCDTKRALNAVLPHATLTFDLAIAPDNPTIAAGSVYPCSHRVKSTAA